MRKLVLFVSVILMFFFVSLNLSAGTRELRTESSSEMVRATYNDLAYASVSNKQKLDIYLPGTGTSPYPVVIWIHGGAFLSGDKAATSELTMINKLVARGFAVASINYRFSTEAIYPAQIHDCKAAVRFLRANAAIYSLDAARFVSWGASAGGCLAALLGTSSGIEELEGSVLGNSEYSSAVQVCVDWFGPIEFLTMDAQAAAQGFTINTNAATSPESRLIGAPIQTAPVQTNKANAMQYVDATDAAFFGQHGTADTNIPMLQTHNLRDALATALGDSKSIYQVLQGAGHGGTAFQTDANVDIITTFINTQLDAIQTEAWDGTVPVLPMVSCYPNPFAQHTTISFELAKAQNVSVDIFNLKGQKVRVLSDGVLNSGLHTVEWNGTDSQGQRLAEGLYFARISSQEDIQTVKLILTK